MAKESTANPRSHNSGATSSTAAGSTGTTGSRRVSDSSSSVDTSERKSFGAIISQSLGEEHHEGIDRILGEMREFFDRGRTYIQENPREAAGLAIACGVGAWALLGTKPGRVLFEAGAAIAIPYVTRWVSTNMKAVSH